MVSSTRKWLFGLGPKWLMFALVVPRYSSGLRDRHGDANTRDESYFCVTWLIDHESTRTLEYIPKMVWYFCVSRSGSSWARTNSKQTLENGDHLTLQCKGCTRALAWIQYSNSHYSLSPLTLAIHLLLAQRRLPQRGHQNAEVCVLLPLQQAWQHGRGRRRVHEWRGPLGTT